MSHLRCHLDVVNDLRPAGCRPIEHAQTVAAAGRAALASAVARHIGENFRREGKHRHSVNSILAAAAAAAAATVMITL